MVQLLSDQIPAEIQCGECLYEEVDMMQWEAMRENEAHRVIS